MEVKATSQIHGDLRLIILVLKFDEKQLWPSVYAQHFPGKRRDLLLPRRQSMASALLATLPQHLGYDCKEGHGQWGYEVSSL